MNGMSAQGGAELILWFMYGCILVLLVTHAGSLVTAVDAVGGEILSIEAYMAGNR